MVSKQHHFCIAVICCHVYVIVRALQTEWAWVLNAAIAISYAC